MSALCPTWSRPAQPPISTRDPLVFVPSGRHVANSIRRVTLPLCRFCFYFDLLDGPRCTLDFSFPVLLDGFYPASPHRLDNWSKPNLHPFRLNGDARLCLSSSACASNSPPRSLLNITAACKKYSALPRHHPPLATFTSSTFAVLSLSPSGPTSRFLPRFHLWAFAVCPGRTAAIPVEPDRTTRGIIQSR